ncbi:MAG: hypothetical protein Q9217_000858 [Psora testacea]
MRALVSLNSGAISYHFLDNFRWMADMSRTKKCEWKKARPKNPPTRPSLTATIAAGVPCKPPKLRLCEGQKQSIVLIHLILPLNGDFLRESSSETRALINFNDRPIITSNDQEMILDLLCDLLSPIGQYRAQHVTRSKGKRQKKRKRNLKPSSSEPEILGPSAADHTESKTPDIPGIEKHTTIGFNTTTRHLESLVKAVEPRTSKDEEFAEDPSLHDGSRFKPLAAVFVPRDNKPPILHAHLPMLCQMASMAFAQSPPTRLVSLSQSAEERLASALNLPRVGLVGIIEGAPGTAPIINYVRQHVTVVEIPWLEKAMSGSYLPVEVKPIHTTAPMKPKDRKRQRNLTPK